MTEDGRRWADCGDEGGTGEEKGKTTDRRPELVGSWQGGVDQAVLRSMKRPDRYL